MCLALRFLPQVVFSLVFVVTAVAAEVPSVLHYFDEVGQRYLTIQSLGGTKVNVLLRWAVDPGSAGTWAGNGERRDNQWLFAATVEEEQDRGAFFIAKGEAKLEVSFRPNQKMPQDPGILGIYRHVSDEKMTQLMKKEFQAADDRLGLALKNASRVWAPEDKGMSGDWKSRWPVLRERWMALAYQAAELPKPKPGQLAPPAAAREAALKEKDSNYWLKLAQATALGYSFVQQSPDPKSKGEWDGEYDDGFGGHVSIRRAKDGKLRVTLTCTRFGELQGMDLSGAIAAEALKTKSGESTGEGVFSEQETAKETQVSLRRKGGFLWLETKRKDPLPSKAAWFDGIYRWMPVPTE